MAINWVIFSVVLICGVGFGIWAAIAGIIGACLIYKFAQATMHCAL